MLRQPLAQTGILGAVSVKFGAQRNDDDGRTLRFGRYGMEQIVYKCFAFGFVFAGREQLFKLIHNQQQVIPAAGACEKSGHEQVKAVRVAGEVVHERGGRRHGFGLAREAGGQFLERMSAGGEDVVLPARAAFRRKRATSQRPAAFERRDEPRAHYG